jgi:pyrimidine-nucleoside phosphorylase
MIISEIIAHKRDGGRHSQKEIAFLIGGFVSGDVLESEMAAWLMAAYIRGLDESETVWLTRAMVGSGSVIDLRELPGPVVDKHSTGGVGDKTTLIAGPLAAAAGVKIPKLSGKALGHTGGTLDKLAAIPGLRTSLSQDKFLAQLNKVGIAVAAQTSNMVPADKKIYALRDRTATVESIPLITSSILSKKAAGGAKNILIDVKVGTGAFMPTLERAEELARSLQSVGRSLELNVNCLITDMNQPLGRSVGNALEIKEVIDALAGNGPADLMEVSVRLAAEMILMAGLTTDLAVAREKIEAVLNSGQGQAVLEQLIESQGGDANIIRDPKRLPAAAHMRELRAERDGFVTFKNCRAIGLAAAVLSGHADCPPRLDMGAGLVVKSRHGDKVIIGQVLVDVFFDDETRLLEAETLIKQAIVITREQPDQWPLIYDNSLTTCSIKEC